MSKKRSSALVLTVGTAIALTAGGAGAYWFLRQRGGGESLTTGPEFIPQQALATFSISTSERQWNRLRSLGTIETQTRFNKQLARFRDSLIKDVGLDYAKDIQPWIGDELTVVLLQPPMDIALPELSDSATTDGSPDESEELEGFTDTEPFEQDEANAEPRDEALKEFDDNKNDDSSALGPALDPELIDPTQARLPVLIIPIADLIKARDRLETTLGDGRTTTKQTYKEVEIQELSVQSEFKFASIPDRQTLILTTDASSMEKVIDTYTGEPSVKDIPGYQQALSRIESPQPFIKIYVNSEIAEPLMAANTVQASLSQGFDFFLLDGQGVAANIDLNNQGLKLQGVSWLKNDAEIGYQRSKPVQLLEQLPQETTMLIAGGNFKQLWDTLEKRGQLGVQGILNPKTIRPIFASVTDLDIDSSLVDWMTGNFAVAVASTPSTLEASPTNSLIIMAEGGDSSPAQKTFSELDEIMKRRHRFQVTSKQVNDIDVTVWTKPLRPEKYTRGILDSGTAFLSISSTNQTPRSANETLLVKPSISLKKNPVFQNATASELDAVDGYFFFDIKNVTKNKSSLLYSFLVPLDLIAKQIRLPFSSEGLFPKKAVSQGAIDAIGLTTAVQDERTAQFSLSVLMPSLENPGSLPDLSDQLDAEEEALGDQ